MTIRRLPGKFPTRSKAVIHDGIATFFSVAATDSPSLYEQTREALASADATLAELGGTKAGIINATVFITDMANKDEMNRAWDEWADRQNPPMRVCVQAGLTGKSLVEILFTAATNE